MANTWNKKRGTESRNPLNFKVPPAGIEPATPGLGKWALLTNEDTMSIEDAASGYKGLMVIERCFSH